MESEKGDLFDYVEGYGNSFDGFGLVALKFTKRILWVDTLRSTFEDTQEHLLVSKTTVGVDRHDAREAALLSQLLCERIGGDRRVSMAKFHNRVLYAFLVRATLPKKIVRIKRDRTFRAVHEILRACHFGTEDFGTCEQLRLLKRNRQNSSKSNSMHSFYALVVHAFHQRFVALVGSAPCSRLAAVLHRARRRAREPMMLLDAGRVLPPNDFYVCEITFETDELLGVRFRTNEQRDYVEYVSPMIVTCVLEEYVDNCHQRTNGWLPLYRSEEWWNRRGFPAFVGRLKANVRDLKGVLEWLAPQTSEKHRLMLADLGILGKIFST